MRFSCAALLALLAVAGALAEPVDPWHQYALTVYMGSVDTPVTLEDKGPYPGRDFGSEAERGISLATAVTDEMALELCLSKLRTSGSLANSSAADSMNVLDVDIEITALWLTWKTTYEKPSALFRPWIGVGLNTGLIEESYGERLYVPGGGYFSESDVTKVSNFWGAHVFLGVNIYPSRNSALCLTVQDRYNFSFSDGSFEGDINSNAFIIGIRWDFSLITE